MMVSKIAMDLRVNLGTKLGRLFTRTIWSLRIYNTVARARPVNDNGRRKRCWGRAKPALLKFKPAFYEPDFIGDAFDVVMPPPGISPGVDQTDNQCSASCLGPGFSHPLRDKFSIGRVHEDPLTAPVLL
jgi:hypothetical protein